MNTIDTFQNRLDKALKIRNMKSVELHEKTGLSESLISKYLSGNAVARQRKIDLLADTLNVNPVWLLGYDVPIDRNADIKTDELGNSVVSIDLLGTIKAGYDWIANEEKIGTVDIPTELAKTGDFFALKVKGDSMADAILEGDIVIIKKQTDCESGQIAAVIINGDEVTIKRVKKTDSGIILQALNNKYEPQLFTYEQMKTIPVEIVGILRRQQREW